MKKTLVLSLILSCLICFAYAQTAPSVKFLKNGKMVGQNDFSISKGNIIEFKIVNPDPKLTFKVDSIYMTVLNMESQMDERAAEVWRREQNKKRRTLRTVGFSQEPLIRIKYEDFYGVESTRLIVILKGVTEIGPSGKPAPSQRFTLGKEYSFWNNRPTYD